MLSTFAYEKIYRHLPLAQNGRVAQGRATKELNDAITAATPYIGFLRYQHREQEARQLELGALTLLNPVVVSNPVATSNKNNLHCLNLDLSNIQPQQHPATNLYLNLSNIQHNILHCLNLKRQR